MHSSMEIIARAPYAQVTSLEAEAEAEEYAFNVSVDCWRNRYSDRGKEPYKTVPGDVLVIADAKPETAADLQRSGRTWTFALVTGIPEDKDEDEDEDEDEDDKEENSSSTFFKVKAPKDIASKYGMQKSVFVVHLMNITTNRRIWNVLHRPRNLKVIREILCTGSTVSIHMGISITFSHYIKVALGQGIFKFPIKLKIPAFDWGNLESGRSIPVSLTHMFDFSHCYIFMNQTQ